MRGDGKGVVTVRQPEFIFFKADQGHEPGIAAVRRGKFQYARQVQLFYQAQITLDAKDFHIAVPGGKTKKSVAVHPIHRSDALGVLRIPLFQDGRHRTDA